MQLRDLEHAAALLAIKDPRVAPAGPIAPFLGEQVSAHQVERAYEDRTDGIGELPAAVLRAVRSFPVRPLVGTRLTCALDQFEVHLRASLTGRLPGTEWPALGRRGDLGQSDALIEKYHLLDGFFVAPRDEATNQTMVLELAGTISGAGGALPYGAPLPDRIVVTITHAHWANVSGLGIGAGFYL